MHASQEILSTTPNRPAADRSTLGDCIDACVECELACTACADACLGEEEVAALKRCIRLNQDCADLCATTARLLARQFHPNVQVLRAALDLCALICAASEAECQRHAAHHRHCGACAVACAKCSELCVQLAQALPGAH